MPRNNYQIRLNDDEIKKLKDMTHKGSNVSAKSIMHANILLNSNNNFPEKKKSNRELAEIFGISSTTVNQIRKTYATEGLEAALSRKTRLTTPTLSKITGDFEAHVVATALGPVPKGKSRWTLRLLAEHRMKKDYIVSISHTAIGEMLNTNQVKPHLSKYWCIPKENDACFVANMEDVLGIYKRAYNPKIPVICMDEKPIQLLDEIRERISAKPLRIDEDTGLPKPGKIEKIILVADNLNTHNPSSFYEAFAPDIAYQLAQKFEFHYTPKHGSWLNIAETELSSLSRRGRFMPNEGT